MNPKRSLHYWYLSATARQRSKVSVVSAQATVQSRSCIRAILLEPFIIHHGSFRPASNVRTLGDGRTTSKQADENRNRAGLFCVRHAWNTIERSSDTKVCPLLRTNNKSGICNWLFSAPGSVLVCHQTGEINHPATMGGVWSASTTLWESTVGGLCIGELVLLLLGLAKTPRKQETPRRQIFLRPAYFNRIISYAYRGAENLSRTRKWTKSGERVEFDESP